MNRNAPIDAEQALEAWAPPARTRFKGLGGRLRIRRDGDQLFDCLARQASNVHDAADVFVQMTMTPESPAIEEAMARVEEVGERVAADIETALRKAWLLRIDREDLHLLSSAMSGVRVFVLRGTRNVQNLGIVAPSEPTRTLAKLIAQSTMGAVHAVAALRAQDYVAVAETSRDLRRVQERARLVRDDALAAMLREGREIEPRQLVREALLLGDLKEAVSRCRGLTELFAWLAAKHG
ncbi:MAG: Phosphate transport regulator [Labilithrix sp.]|nr:Phosphate transport regulator [Labilithrix sp.]